MTTPRTTTRTTTSLPPRCSCGCVLGLTGGRQAREYDRRLRGPVDEATELAIDPETGLKNYIANERIGRLASGEPMVTSAALVRRLFGSSIELGRRHARDGHDRDLFEAFRLMGTGLHCLEDFSAHSNYCELALAELGEPGVFAHVGARAAVTIHGREVWPLVTGTFGGVDFLHSVLGEVSDKTIQSEVQQLESAMSDAQNTAERDGSQESIIKDLFARLNLGSAAGSAGSGDDIAAKADELKAKSAAQKEAARNSPWGLGSGADDVAREIYPFLEFHDNLMKASLPLSPSPSPSLSFPFPFLPFLPSLSPSLPSLSPSLSPSSPLLPLLPPLRPIWPANKPQRINEALETIGIEAIVEKLSEAVSMFVFSLLAPFILPIIRQVNTELKTGSSEVIASSEAAQHIVFEHDYSSDPTHSMLAKDHFTNVFSPPTIP